MARKTPRAHQELALDRYRSSDQLPLFFEMRLGKSLVVIRWLEEKMGRDGPLRILIVAPVTPMVGWIQELLSEGYYHKVLKADSKSPAEGFNLCSYAFLARNPELARFPWDAVVLDESTAIKNPAAIVTKLAVKNLSKARYRAILSGLPDPESIFDLWTQMAFANGGDWMGKRNFYEWRDWISTRHGFTWHVDGMAEEAVKTQLHSDAMFLSRKDVGMGGEKVYERRSRPAEPETLRIYNQVKKTYASDGREAKHAIAAAIWCHKISGGHTPEGEELPCWKYGEVIELLETELRDQQVVVWCQYSLEMVRMFRALKAAGVPTTFVQGATTLQERAERRLAFQEGRKRVIIMQVQCGKFGFDLSAADTAIYLSNPLGYEAKAQSEDRVVSLDKSGGLLIIDLISEGTADEDILDALQLKENSANEIARRILD